jgi:hypothetical protein
MSYGMDDLFGGHDAQKLRDEALARMLARHASWRDKAMAILNALPRDWQGMGEDGRRLVEARLGPIPDPHLWGAIWNKAVMQRHWFHSIGWKKPKGLKSHASKKQIWRRT